MTKSLNKYLTENMLVNQLLTERMLHWMSIRVSYLDCITTRTTLAFHWINVWLNEYVFEQILDYMSTLLNENLAEWILDWTSIYEMTTSANNYHTTDNFNP